jgi:hypothetical protein
MNFEPSAWEPVYHDILAFFESNPTWQWDGETAF